MRIVNREEFLKLSKYTLFCLYDEDEANDCDRIGQLTIKHESLEADWLECYTTEVWFDKEMEDEQQWDKALNGESVKMDMTRTGRDAMFIQHQLFMIYEKEDLLQLQEIVNKAVQVTTNE